jgi:hypothetical protein
MKTVFYNVELYQGHSGNKSYYSTTGQFKKRAKAVEYAKQSKSCQSQGYKIVKVLENDFDCEED